MQIHQLTILHRMHHVGNMDSSIIHNTRSVMSSSWECLDNTSGICRSLRIHTETLSLSTYVYVPNSSTNRHIFLDINPILSQQIRKHNTIFIGSFVDKIDYENYAVLVNLLERQLSHAISTVPRAYIFWYVALFDVWSVICLSRLCVYS